MKYNFNKNIEVYFGCNNKLTENNKIYPNNLISTTKYNLITIIPKGLLIQFKKAANIYFLLITILSFLNFSPKDPSSQVGTFAFVLIATLVKEAIEDYGRYKQDKISNNKLVYYLNKGKWEKIKCWKLIPGNIIKLQKDEELCADILITYSSNSNGYCYIDTKNLDGETNLKEKVSLEEFKNFDTFKSTSGTIFADKPNDNINSWNGLLKLNYNNNEYKDIYLDLKNIVLKGCVLKNTDYCIGVVIYSGKNTKIMKNSKLAINKVSNVLKMMNKLLYSLLFFQFIICLGFALLNLSWVNNHKEIYWYIFQNYKHINYNYSNNNLYTSKSNESNVLNLTVYFLIYFIAYSNIIPISLYVTLEMVKIAQGVLIYYDNDIYDFDLDKPALCKTTDLIEELGQVEFIFSDKTGTLTQNVMILKKVFINGKIYGSISDDPPLTKFTINGDRSLKSKIVSNNCDDNSDKLAILEYFNLLSVCHSVFPDKNNDNNIVYQGASPDDIALVKGAQQLGIEFYKKDFNTLYVNNSILSKENLFEIKAEIPFDSDRKRMTVLVHDKVRNKIIVYIKGADTSMIDRFINIDKIKSLNTSKNNYLYSYSLSIDEINKVIKIFSKEGLRVLCMGYKEISTEVYNQWNSKYQSKRNTGQDLTDLYEELESNIMFLGCSAIEDKLQEGVPEAIYTLLSCNIRIWVLTGDKQDTAEEIAKSCNLIDDSMFTLYFCDDGSEDYNVEEELKNQCKYFDINYNLNESNNTINQDDINTHTDNLNIENITNKIKVKHGKDLSIIIDGKSLTTIFESNAISKLFFRLAIAAKSVICCRVSPKQKAKVVSLAKKNGKWLTLAIGDGANDVPMIMEAHIGIGIQGKEGTQAVRSSDYAIGQFRFLEKLLLVYGRQGYKKISKFICYYFYKNILAIFTEIYFTFYNGYSGNLYFADYLSTMYNAFFTSWPVLVTFVFEKDVDLNIVKKFPSLYKAGQKNYYFNLKEFWIYILYAIFHGAICFYVTQYSLFFLNSNTGIIVNHWVKSTISFTLVIHIANLKLLIISDYWNYINIISTIFSIFFYYVCLILFSTKEISFLLQIELANVIYNMFSSSLIVIIIFFVPFVALLPDISFKLLKINGKPNPVQYITTFLKEKEFTNWVFKEEQRVLLFNTRDAKSADRDIKEILKKHKNKSKMLNSNYFTDNYTENTIMEHSNHNKLKGCISKNSKIKKIFSNSYTKLKTNYIYINLNKTLKKRSKSCLLNKIKIKNLTRYLKAKLNNNSNYLNENFDIKHTCNHAFQDNLSSTKSINNSLIKNNIESNNVDYMGKQTNKSNSNI